MTLISRLLLAVAVSAGSQLHAAENEVLILGRRAESRRVVSSGQTTIIVPSEPSRFESDTHLKSLSASLSQDTGQVTASGFSLPRMRGHDFRMTSLFIEDLQLYDPNANLPVADEVDLRAFGQLEVFSGVSPVDVPDLNVSGGLRYRLRPLAESTFGLGGGYGSLLGQTQWLNAAKIGPRSKDAWGTDLRVYARRHQAKGDYDFYSDEGTPYNARDDRTRKRINNATQSNQVLPHFGIESPYGDLRGLWLANRSHRQLPSSSPLITSEAEQESSTQLAYLKYWHPLDISIAYAQYQNERTLTDPSNLFVPLATFAELAVTSRSLELAHHRSLGSTEAYVHWKSSRTSLDRRLDQTDTSPLRRGMDQWNLALEYPLPLEQPITVAVKSEWRMLNDETKPSADQIGDELAEQKRSRFLRSFALLANGRWDKARAYAQFSRSMRPPSLVEEFGDGATVLQQQDLRPENVQHYELGVDRRGILATTQIGLAIYHDRVDDKIAMLPALSNSIRAVNLRRTQVTGLDLYQESHWRQFHIQFAVTRLFPYDLSSDRQRIIPSTPELVVASALGWSHHGWHARWSQRTRSEMYRDSSNQILLPGVTIHDLSLDWRWVGISVKNALDTQSTAISAPSTPQNRGRTAVADFAGAPLPGRSWTAQLAIEL